MRVGRNKQTNRNFFSFFFNNNTVVEFAAVVKVTVGADSPTAGEKQMNLIFSAATFSSSACTGSVLIQRRFYFWACCRCTSPNSPAAEIVRTLHNRMHESIRMLPYQQVDKLNDNIRHCPLERRVFSDLTPVSAGRRRFFVRSKTITNQLHDVTVLWLRFG